MRPPSPLVRGQGNEPFRTADPKSAAKRGQTIPYDVNGAPAGGSVNWGAILGTLADQADLAAALAALAPLLSPTFTGTPRAPTAAPGTNTTQLATTAFVAAAVAALINSAPGVLDTLDELAAALGDDANFASTVTTALAGKQPLDSDLTALAGNGTNGFWVRTGAGTGSARAIVGTANEITVGNGDGVAANPALSLPSALTFTGKTVTGGVFSSLTGLSMNAAQIVFSGTAAFGATLTNTAIAYRSSTHGLVLAGVGGTNDVALARADGTLVANIPTGSTTFNITGTLQCDALRIDATTTAGVVAGTHTIPININGVAGRMIVAIP